MGADEGASHHATQQDVEPRLVGHGSSGVGFWGVVRRRQRRTFLGRALESSSLLNTVTRGWLFVGVVEPKAIPVRRR